MPKITFLLPFLRKYFRVKSVGWQVLRARQLSEKNGEWELGAS